MRQGATCSHNSDRDGAHEGGKTGATSKRRAAFGQHRLANRRRTQLGVEVGRTGTAGIDKPRIEDPALYTSNGDQ